VCDRRPVPAMRRAKCRRCRRTGGPDRRDWPPDFGISFPAGFVGYVSLRKVAYASGGRAGAKLHPQAKKHSRDTCSIRYARTHIAGAVLFLFGGRVVLIGRK
jgi:hypothetical protein